VLACSNAVQLVLLQPIIILFHHYKELKECLSEVEQTMMMMMESRVSNNDKDNKHKVRRLMRPNEEPAEPEEEQALLTDYY